MLLEDLRQLWNFYFYVLNGGDFVIALIPIVMIAILFDFYNKLKKAEKELKQLEDEIQNRRKNSIIENYIE